MSTIVCRNCFQRELLVDGEYCLTCYRQIFGVHEEKDSKTFFDIFNKIK